MSQKDIDQAVANVTGENIGLIHDIGFSIADPFDVSFDPEPRRPFVLDWDSMDACRMAGLIQLCVASAAYAVFIRDGAGGIKIAAKFWCGAIVLLLD